MARDRGGWDAVLVRYAPGLALFLALFTAPFGATAAETPSESSIRSVSAGDEVRLLEIEGVLGLGTPLGYAGMSIVSRALRPLVLSTGLGAASQGVQWALGARGELDVSSRERLAFGLVWSAGRYAAGSLVQVVDATDVYYWRHARVVSLEVSLSERISRALSARPFLGLGVVTNPGDAICANPSSTCNASTPTRAVLIPYLGIAAVCAVL